MSILAVSHFNTKRRNRFFVNQPFSTEVRVMLQLLAVHTTNKQSVKFTLVCEEWVVSTTLAKISLGQVMSHYRRFWNNLKAHLQFNAILFFLKLHERNKLKHFLSEFVKTFVTLPFTHRMTRCLLYQINYCTFLIRYKNS